MAWDRRYRGEVQELRAVQRHHPRRIARLARTVPPLAKQTHRHHIGRHRFAKALYIQDWHAVSQAHRIVVICQAVVASTASDPSSNTTPGMSAVMCPPVSRMPAGGVAVTVKSAGAVRKSCSGISTSSGAL